MIRNSKRKQMFASIGKVKFSQQSQPTVSITDTKPKLTRKQRNERNDAIVAKVKDGIEYHLIAEEYGLTVGRISQIMSNYEDAANRKKEMKMEDTSVAPTPLPEVRKLRIKLSRRDLRKLNRVKRWEDASKNVSIVLGGRTF